MLVAFGLSAVCGGWLFQAVQREAREQANLRAKLGRLKRSERLAEFPAIEKLVRGTAGDRKKLTQEWLAACGDPDRVESKLKVTAGVLFRHDEVEQKLTVRSR